MFQGLEDARKLAHGTYDDVIVVEHRKPAPGSAASGSAVHVVLELPEGGRAIDTSGVYAIDGAVGEAAPTVGGSYRLIVDPTTAQASLGAATPGSTLRYETMTR